MENPQASNRYAYVYNNPLRFTDPSGHGIWDDIKELGGDVVDWAVDRGKTIVNTGANWAVGTGGAVLGKASNAYDLARGGARSLVGLDNKIDQ